MTEAAKTRALEHRPHPYRFDLARLTVVADRPDRPIPMFRMGGGQNWLGCHLIALLALHSHFIEAKRPVPRFLVLDQPSQVYFASPDIYRAMPGTTNATLAAQADMEAVRRMFEFLRDFCRAAAPNFQILVLEHANLEDQWFQDALVEEPWAGTRALIPQTGSRRAASKSALGDASGASCSAANVGSAVSSTIRGNRRGHLEGPRWAGVIAESTRMLHEV
jgi:hypothetical protein